MTYKDEEWWFSLMLRSERSESLEARGRPPPSRRALRENRVLDALVLGQRVIESDFLVREACFLAAGACRPDVEAGGLRIMLV
jgi:hypothetical protein